MSNIKPTFVNRPYTKELFYFLINLGWKMRLHPNSGERFIHNGDYDRNAKSNGGLYKGKDGKYYYCSFQEYLKEDGSFDFFQYSIKKKSRTVRDSTTVLGGCLHSREEIPVPPGWPTDPTFQWEVTKEDIREKIDEIKDLIKTL